MQGKLSTFGGPGIPNRSGSHWQCAGTSLQPPWSSWEGGRRRQPHCCTCMRNPDIYLLFSVYRIGRTKNFFLRPSSVVWCLDLWLNQPPDKLVVEGWAVCKQKNAAKTRRLTCSTKKLRLQRVQATAQGSTVQAHTDTDNRKTTKNNLWHRGLASHCVVSQCRLKKTWALPRPTK